jgi:hypothetical protein
MEGEDVRNLYFVVIAVLFLAALIAILLRYYLRARSSRDSTWEDILKRLTWIDRDMIATIALDVIEESGEPRPQDKSFALEPSRIWALLGGLDGIEVIEHNCQVLVELASYMQQWHPEALVVAEQLRLNAREIEWHAGRLKGAAETGNLQSSFAAYAQRATVTYYLMTRHVLELYRQVSFPRLADLQQAI